ncbi:MAG: NifU family protein [Flavobacteriales bacterium]|nr:NifU family protein [Flavobacteriales bacterium]|tara:strand:+ start:649 stop:1227 length:579 start_codon:yes stop_codon:yes gene_type:complete
MSDKIPFIIYAESTPNPSVMKFVSNKILTEITKEITNIQEASGWPLLQQIFEFPFVKEIFISNNYISIKKHDTAEWTHITNQIRIFIQDKLNSDILICENKQLEKESVNIKKNKSKLERQIEDVINTNIKPNIQMDGGDIELVSCVNKTVKVFLKGACSGCPSSQMTLKHGIETLLKERFPNKINEVIAINT